MGRRIDSRLKVIWGLAIVLTLIGIIAVVRRSLVLLIGVGTSPETAMMDAGFAAHPALTFLHILPGGLFMLLCPLQFIGGLRSRHRVLHRWCGRLLVALGIIAAITALVMGFTVAIGGANETAATTLFALAFLFALTRGALNARRRQFALHREWMLRAFGIALGVSTTRPVVGLFFTTRMLPPEQFFGIAFWIGFVLTALGAEVWINITRVGVAFTTELNRSTEDQEQLLIS